MKRFLYEIRLGIVIDCHFAENALLTLSALVDVGGTKLQNPSDEWKVVLHLIVFVKVAFPSVRVDGDQIGRNRGQEKSNRQEGGQGVQEIDETTVGKEKKRDTTLQTDLNFQKNLLSSSVSAVAWSVVRRSAVRRSSVAGRRSLVGRSTVATGRSTVATRRGRISGIRSRVPVVSVVVVVIIVIIVVVVVVVILVLALVLPPLPLILSSPLVFGVGTGIQVITACRRLFAAQDLQFITKFGSAFNLNACFQLLSTRQLSRTFSKAKDASGLTGFQIKLICCFQRFSNDFKSVFSPVQSRSKGQ